MIPYGQADDRRLKDDWAEHRKGGKELKESLKRLRTKRIVV